MQGAKKPTTYSGSMQHKYHENIYFAWSQEVSFQNSNLFSYCDFPSTTSLCCQNTAISK